MNDLTSDEMAFLAELKTLAGQIQPDKGFVDTLEARLKSEPPSTNYVRIFSRIAAALVLFFILTLSLPPLRAIAQELVDLFFYHAESDEKTNTYTAATADRTEIGYKTVEEAEADLGIDLLEPDFVPSGYVLTSVSATTFTYEIGAGGRLLFVCQSPVNATDRLCVDSEVGASAEIVPVTLKIGDQDISAQYVEGGWIVKNSGERTAGQTVTEELEWRSDVSARRLLWQHADSYFVLYAGGGSPDHPGYVGKEELIAIAESMR